jgi:hypothetical protein
LLGAVRYAGARATTSTAVVAVMVLPTAADLRSTGGAEAAAVAGAILLHRTLRFTAAMVRQWAKRQKVEP